jgi:dihydropteroate synthase
MGIVNVTPDSFFSPSRHDSAISAADEALAMEAQGAAIIDVGGESTRPGSDYVGEAEELARVLPAIEAIRARSGITLSVDTRHSSVAAAALDAGADIINDITALYGDPAMLGVVLAKDASVVLMHMQGEPKTMQRSPSYVDCAVEVRDFLAKAASRARAAGIGEDRILVDPGIGFGKALSDNLELLSRLDAVVDLGYPVLAGLSRKAFVGAITGKDAEGRLAGSLGAACAAYERGARVFRVHDVAATVDALAVYAAIFNRDAIFDRAVVVGRGVDGDAAGRSA